MVDIAVEDGIDFLESYNTETGETVQAYKMPVLSDDWKLLYNELNSGADEPDEAREVIVAAFALLVDRYIAELNGDAKAV